MKIIEIAALENGAHRNQNGTLSKVPEGWAMIPEDMVLENFPFGEVTAEEVEYTTTQTVTEYIDGELVETEIVHVETVMTVTGWVPGVLPEPEPEPVVEKEPTADEILNAMLGVTE